MKDNFSLFHTFNLSKFIVKIYEIKSSETKISLDEMIGLTDTLNIQEYPRGIVETLTGKQGVGKIEVFDHNNKKLLGSQVFMV